MAKNNEVTRTEKGALTGDEAEKLFEVVDETGHTNEETARKQRARKQKKGSSVDFDPLAGEDPSGADTDRQITRMSFIVIAVFVAVVVSVQLGWSYLRRVTTSTLTEDASMRSVVSAINLGVEWGGGFTQFPPEFIVHEADENTHRIEVTVIDSDSPTDLDAFATAQVQSSALSVNALLNPNIDTVVYNVKLRRDDEGRIQNSTFFGFMRPKGVTSPFMTFVWHKTLADDGGLVFDCSITGLDEETQERLYGAITSKSTPAAIINYVMTGNDKQTAENVLAAAKDNEALGLGIEELKEAAKLEAEAQKKAKEKELAEKQEAEEKEKAQVE